MSGDPDEWFTNADYVTLDTQNPDGSIWGISIDEDTGEVLMVRGGDRINLIFDVDGHECVFSFGPGSEIAVAESDGGYALIPEVTANLSPP